MYKLRGIMLGFIVFIIYRLVSWSWRIQLVVPEKLKDRLKTKTPFILAHFHGDEAALLFLTKPYKLSTMISTSKDGEMMAVVYGLLGGKSSRGSSTRGGVSALRGLIELVKKGSSCNIAVDGPKGPLHEVKPGVFELSRLLKCEIYASGAYCESAWKFPRSWNQAYLPKPFARLVIAWTEPLGPITKASDPRSPELANVLRQQLFIARGAAQQIYQQKA